MALMAPADEGIDTTQEGEGLMVHDVNPEGKELMAHDVNSEGQKLMAHDVNSVSEKSFPNSNCLQVVARPQYAVSIVITLRPDPKRSQGGCKAHGFGCKAIPSLSQLVQFIWIPYLS